MWVLNGFLAKNIGTVRYNFSEDKKLENNNILEDNQKVIKKLESKIKYSNNH